MFCGMNSIMRARRLIEEMSSKSATKSTQWVFNLKAWMWMGCWITLKRILKHDGWVLLWLFRLLTGTTGGMLWIRRTFMKCGRFVDHLGNCYIPQKVSGIRGSLDGLLTILFSYYLFLSFWMKFDLRMHYFILSCWTVVSELTANWQTESLPIILFLFCAPDDTKTRQDVCQTKTERGHFAWIICGKSKYLLGGRL